MYVADGQPLPATYAPIPSGITAVAVGWLDAEHDYNKGSVDEAFVARLFEACRTHAVARTRAWHRCPFCHTESSIGYAAPTTVERGGDSLVVGDAEIRVVAKDRTWLVAPTLVLHYVTDHAYAPPPSFIEAVTSGRFAPA